MASRDVRRYQDGESRAPFTHPCANKGSEDRELFTAFHRGRETAIGRWYLFRKKKKKEKSSRHVSAIFIMCAQTYCTLSFLSSDR